jgi:hypothetical protein
MAFGDTGLPPSNYCFVNQLGEEEFATNLAENNFE